MQPLKKVIKIDMDVFKNSATPKSSILIGVSIINHPFRGTPIFGNTHIELDTSGTPPIFSTPPPEFGEVDETFGGNDTTRVAKKGKKEMVILWKNMVWTFFRWVLMS